MIHMPGLGRGRFRRNRRDRGCSCAVRLSAIIVILPDFIAMMDDDFEDDEEIPTMSRSSTEAYMEETQSSSAHARRNEDIALDLMKFVAMTTGYGRTTSSGVGFQGTGAASKPEEYAAHLLELYGKCVAAVGGKK
jgi:hypothetical protein